MSLERNPDGIDVVASVKDVQAGAMAPLLVLDAIEGFLDANGLGTGPIAWTRIGEGQSNITYLLERDGVRLVLRRGPRPPLPRSTHDMVREARVQRALGAAGFPVPQILAVHEGDDLLGVPFYVMSYLDGWVTTDVVPAPLDSPDGQAGMSRVLIDTLADLHSIDVSAGELAALGRPEGYLRRQVERFRTLWQDMAMRPIPEIDDTATWLDDHLPESPPATLVHGDYRLGNLMLARESPARVQAVLDWEMATLGDPLADLGYLAATYSRPGQKPTTMHLSPVTALPGFLPLETLVQRYTERTGIDTGALGWYEALAYWKASIFSEAIYLRWKRGERPGDAFGPSLESGVPELARAAQNAAQNARM